MKKNKKNAFGTFKLIVFFMYNLAYILYMTGYIRRWINLAILAIFILLCIYQFLYERKKVGKKNLFVDEFMSAMFIVISFLSISLIIQARHGNFKTYLFSELLYNIIPPTLAFFWINTTQKDDLKKYFYIFLIRTILYFFLINGSNLNIQNIISINWKDSSSSIFEVPLAHDFLFLEIIFLYMKKPRIAAICMVLCILSFKRISFILSLLFFILYILFGKKTFGEKNKNIEVSKKTRVFVFIIMCITPFLLNWIISDSGISYFGTKGIDLNKFTSGRVTLIQFVNSHIGYYNGYGSSNNFLRTIGFKAGSMHCDILRLYYEVTMVGLGIFAYEMIKISKRKKIIFIMLIYIFMELFSSHFLDALSVWNLFFMFAAFVYSKDENTIEYNNNNNNI